MIGSSRRLLSAPGVRKTTMSRRSTDSCRARCESGGGGRRAEPMPMPPYSASWLASRRAAASRLRNLAAAAASRRAAATTSASAGESLLWLLWLDGERSSTSTWSSAGAEGLL